MKRKTKQWKIMEQWLKQYNIDAPRIKRLHRHCEHMGWLDNVVVCVRRTKEGWLKILAYPNDMPANFVFMDILRYETPFDTFWET